MQLELNDSAKKTFTINIRPYFNTIQCSVDDCINDSVYVCEYHFEDKYYSKSKRQWIYHSGDGRRLYLCTAHFQTKYIDLDYNPDRVITF